MNNKQPRKKRNPVKDIVVAPTKSENRLPKCFGQRVMDNKCIKCVWIQRCTYESNIEEILNLKSVNTEEYIRVKNSVLNTTSFEY